MTSESIHAPLVPPVVPELPSNLGIGNNKPHPIQENGGGSQRKLIEEETPVSKVKPTEDPKPAEESKQAEELQLKTRDPSIPANGTSREPLQDNKTEQPGVKRDHEANPTATDAEKPSTEESAEPAPKKQKISEEHTDTTDGTSAPVAEVKKKVDQPANGEKKKAGRPKKTKDSIKKSAPTDGIGSRTRSRTKVVS